MKVEKLKNTLKLTYKGVGEGVGGGIGGVCILICVYYFSLKMQFAYLCIVIMLDFTRIRFA